MNYVYVTALIDLSVSVRMQSPLELRDNTYITNNPKHIKRFLKHQDLMAIGRLEADLLMNGSPVVYRTGDVPQEILAHAEIVNLLREVQAFLTALWLHGDNSANCELGFAVGQSNTHVHSNSLVFNYSTCSGERTSTAIDQAQLSEVAETFRQNFTGIRKQDELEFTMFQKESGRQNVSMMFLQQARSSIDLGQKIANYCSYFEALLSTNAAELSHQLSERAAFLLRLAPQERFDHFKRMKRAYAIRSKVVHGDVVSKKQIPDLKDIAAHCDQTARELLSYSIRSDELKTLFRAGDSEAIDEFMLKRIFGLTE